MLLFVDMEEAVGSDFEEGLGTLKQILEENEKSESTEKESLSGLSLI
jgi:hypothetical protein